MLYEYECNKCEKVTESVFSVASFPREITCPTCGGNARKIISIPVVHGDELSEQRLKELNQSLVTPGQKPITSRSEYKQHLKTNNLVHA